MAGLLPLALRDSLLLYLEGARALSSQFIFTQPPPELPAVPPALSLSDPPVCLVTGAAQGGIGHAIALSLARKGWLVIATALPGEQTQQLRECVKERRNSDKERERGGEEERDEAKGRMIRVLSLDLRSPQSVSDLAKDVTAAVAHCGPNGRLSLIVHCAGVMLCPPHRTTLPPSSSSVDEHMLVNVLMPLQLTLALLPCLVQTPVEDTGKGKGARLHTPPPFAPTVVMVSSCVHRIAPLDLPFLKGERGVSPARAYAQSKLGQILAARWLAAHVPAVRFAAAHPGVADTRLYRYTPWLVRLGQALGGKMLLRSAEAAAEAVLGAAAVVQADASQSGEYFEDGLPTAPAAHAQGDTLAETFMAWAHEALGLDTAAWLQKM